MNTEPGKADPRDQRVIPKRARRTSRTAPGSPAGTGRTAVFAIGPFKIGWGAFPGELINFIIIAFVIFLVTKYLFKEAKVTKK